MSRCIAFIVCCLTYAVIGSDRRGTAYGLQEILVHQAGVILQ